MREWFGCPYIAEETPELSFYRERAYNDMVLIIVTCGGGVLLAFVIMIMAIWQSVRSRPHPLRTPLCFLKLRGAPGRGVETSDASRYRLRTGV